MAEIAVKPRVFNKYALKIGADNYEAHVSSVAFTPSAAVQTWTGADGNSHSDTGTATWTCGLTFAQDWETPNSLSLYLLNNEGEHVEVEFSPLETGPTITATIILTPGSIGGDIGAYGTASVTLGVDGKPEYSAAD